MLYSSHVLAFKLLHCDELGPVSRRQNESVHTQSVELVGTRFNRVNNGQLVGVCSIHLIRKGKISRAMRSGHEGLNSEISPIAIFNMEYYGRLVVVLLKSIALRIVPVVFEKKCQLGSNPT